MPLTDLEIRNAAPRDKQYKLTTAAVSTLSALFKAKRSTGSFLMCLRRDYATCWLAQFRRFDLITAVQRKRAKCIFLNTSLSVGYMVSSTIAINNAASPNLSFSGLPWLLSIQTYRN